MNWFFLFSALGLLLWFFALLYLKSYIKRRTDSNYILDRIREEIRTLEAELDEKTEQDLQLMEERILSLRELSVEAERRIAAYTRELERNRTEEAALSSLSRVNTIPSGPVKGAAPEKSGRGKTKTAGRKPRQPVRPLLDTLEVREIRLGDAAGAYRAEVLAPPAQKTPPPEAVPLAAAPPPKAAPLPDTAGIRIVRSGQPIVPRPIPMRERVAELHQTGFSPDMIAARLGLTVAETELYIAMNR